MKNKIVFGTWLIACILLFILKESLYAKACAFIAFLIFLFLFLNYGKKKVNKG